MTADGRSSVAPRDVSDLPDLSTRTAVHDLVVDFYREIVFDDLLEHVFGDVAEVDWEVHIPKLVDYWCRILLDDPGPRYPIMAAHHEVHAIEALRPEHCDRWWTLWSACIDRGWRGPRATQALDHATSLMSGMARHVFGFEWSPPVSSARSARRSSGCGTVAARHGAATTAI